MSECYIRCTESERDALREVRERRFGEESRITAGGMIRLLAEEYMNES